MPNRTSKPPLSRRRVVALLVESSNRYCRELLHGVYDYVRAHGEWTLQLSEQGRGDVPPPWMAKWRGNGIIARIENPAIERAVRATRVPVVNVSATGLAPDLPVVKSHSAGIARLAAEHLRGCGLRNFAYCGDARFPWSAQHGRNFATQVAAHGGTCAVFDARPEDATDWQRARARLHAWLRALPRPVGIMACYDIRAQQVLDACRELGLRVPDEVGVIGQHNDELLCELCDPPLSSVIPNPRRAGHEAAALLDRLMRGKRVTRPVVEVEPLGIAARQSTNLLAVGDARVAAALRHIRAHATEGINVADVLKAVPMSRTLLERQFKRLLGRTPHEEILETRLRRAGELLTATARPIGEIAEAVGFASPEYMSAVFRRRFHQSPRAFRQQHTSSSQRLGT